MPSPNTVFTADSYVKEGLVFQLDGIEYGGIDGQWIDRVRGLIFNASDIQHYPLGFHFNGQKFVTSSGSIPLGAKFTPEVTYNYEGSADSVIFNLPAPSTYTIALRSPTTVVMCPGSSSYVWQLPGTVITLSKKERSCIANGEICQVSGSAFYNPGTKICVGGRNWGGNYIFRGTIYAIRVYSRQLSDREILINQKIDNARFGLGLNIPDEVQPATRSLSLLEPFTLPDDYESEQEPTNETSDER